MTPPRWHPARYRRALSFCVPQRRKSCSAARFLRVVRLRRLAAHVLLPSPAMAPTGTPGSTARRAPLLVAAVLLLAGVSQVRLERRERASRETCDQK